jgi:hypothetical protein
MMMRTQNGSLECVDLFATVPPKEGASEGDSSSSLKSWNVQVFVDVVKEMVSKRVKEGKIHTHLIFAFILPHSTLN